MGSGVNVRVAHALGAGKHKDTVETVHTALLLCMMMGLLIGAVCFFFSGRMLMLLHTKDDLIGQASLYLKIYAIGLPAMGIYNFGNGVLSARGETKRPLYYLAIAGVLNVILNLFFVIVLHMASRPESRMQFSQLPICLYRPVLILSILSWFPEVLRLQTLTH